VGGAGPATDRFKQQPCTRAGRGEKLLKAQANLEVEAATEA